MSRSFSLSLHMVASLDGYIAKPDNSVAWFETTCDYPDGADAPDAEDFLKKIDCYLMGAKSYEHAMELSVQYGWPYGEVPTIVLSSRTLPNERSNVSFYHGDLNTLVETTLKPKYKNVWLVGGPAVGKSFLEAGLVNEIRVIILPIILGEGLPYFDHIQRELPLRLKESVAYKNGMVELCYEVMK